jgi:hypothetical protein
MSADASAPRPEARSVHLRTQQDIRPTLVT